MSVEQALFVRYPSDVVVSAQSPRENIKQLQVCVTPSQKEIFSNDVQPDDVIGMYLVEIAESPKINNTQRDQMNSLLIERVETGRVFYYESVNKQKKKMAKLTDDGITARNEILILNRPLVISRAVKFRNRGVSFEDLISAGNEGFIRGIELFVSKGHKTLSTYAVHWIDKMIFDEIYDHSRTIRIPVKSTDWLTKVNQAKSNLNQSLREEPTNIDIAKQLHMSLEDYQEKMLKIPKKLSLEEPVGNEDDELGDFIPDVKQRPERDVEIKLNIEVLQDALRTLTHREITVMNHRYGLLDGNDLTQEEVGKIVGVKKARVQQIEKQALMKLRGYEKFRE